MNDVSPLIRAIAEVGRDNPLPPPLGEVKPFQSFLGADGKLDASRLDERDGGCTRRELVARFLLLCAVLDQGPDLAGVRLLLTRVLNRLYESEIRILHRPLDFFRELNVSAEEILEKHRGVKAERMNEWARVNQSIPEKYNLFVDGAKQVLNYAVFRWGVPLALPHVLEKRAGGDRGAVALLDHLEQFESAEAMSREIKDNEQFGLGKAVGDKACHLFAKWMVATFHLTRKTGDGWGPYSFEIPYDSNAGRVLWRAGYFLRWAEEADYAKKEVVQPGRGKGGKKYIRVTNIRGMKSARAELLSSEFMDDYAEICTKHLRTHKRRPEKPEIQRLQHVFLLREKMGPAEFDDGLIHVGRNFCLNHEAPKCESCPLREHCEGRKRRPELITDYRT